MIRLSTAKKIDCPIFQAKEDLVLADIVAAANGTPLAQEKISKIEELMEEIGTLISCPAYGENLEQCRACREICKMRRQRIATKLCSVYQNNNHNNKTKLSFANFKKLPGEIEKDVKESKKLFKTL